jgi:hypothetical protein
VKRAHRLAMIWSYLTLDDENFARPVMAGRGSFAK